MILRKALASDLAAVLNIERAWSYAPWCMEALKSALIPPYIFILLEEDAQVVGYAIAQCNLYEASLLTIAIHPGYQGQGFGKLLLQAMLERVFQTPVEALFLEVAITNLKAQGLYQKMGFKKVGIRKEFYPDPKGAVDGLTMHLSRELFFDKRPIH